MRCSAPSPSAAIAIARDRQTASRASANARTSSAAIEGPPAAPLASTKTASLVDVSPSTDTWLKLRSTAGRSSDPSVAVSTGASVVRKASIVAICGWIMPEPLAMPPMRITRPSARRVETACSFGARVGGHDRPCRLPRRGPRATWLQGGDDGLHGGYRKPRADEAGRGREDLVRLAAEVSGSRSHDGARVVQSAGTGPGVRAAGVHDDSTHGRGAGGERLLGQQHRRRPHQVGGEGRRRACRPVGRQQHQVGAARLADAGHADGHREALRGRDPSGDDGCAHG